MAKKVKDYYDLIYAEDLSRRLQNGTVQAAFGRVIFYQFI